MDCECGMDCPPCNSCNQPECECQCIEVELEETSGAGEAEKHW